MPDASNPSVPNVDAAPARPAGARTPDAPSAEVSVPPVTVAATDFPKEVELWMGRTHWKHFLPRISLWVLGAIIVTWILVAAFKGGNSDKGEASSSNLSWIIALIWLVSGAIVLGQIALRILGQRYRVTSQRLFIERGILSQTIDQTELIRVDDVRIYKSVLDRFIGLGTVEVVSTDKTDVDVRLIGIGTPELVAEHIRNNMRLLRNRRGLYVENV